MLPAALPPEVQQQLVPVGWIIGAIVTAVATILTVAWRGFLWLRAQIREVSDASNDKALSSDAHKAVIRDIVQSAFTNHAETEHLYRQDVQMRLTELRARADAQAVSISEAHRRVDRIQEKL
jgi:hypothetical protein